MTEVASFVMGTNCKSIIVGLLGKTKKSFEVNFYLFFILGKLSLCTKQKDHCLLNIYEHTQTHTVRNFSFKILKLEFQKFMHNNYKYAYLGFAIMFTHKIKGPFVLSEIFERVWTF